MLTESDVQDFLQTADSIFHKKVSAVQIEIHKRREKYIEELLRWEENQEWTDNRLENYLHQFDVKNRWELQQQIRRLDMERAKLKLQIMLTVNEQDAASSFRLP